MSRPLMPFQSGWQGKPGILGYQRESALFDIGFYPVFHLLVHQYGYAAIKLHLTESRASPKAVSSSNICNSASEDFVYFKVRIPLTIYSPEVMLLLSVGLGF
jgi:hypothetical protein